MAAKGFRPLLLISLGLAILAFVALFAMALGSYTIRASAVLAGSWVSLVVYAFAKFKKRGLWFLLGTPLIYFWFALFLVAWACTHNVKACPSPSQLCWLSP